MNKNISQLGQTVFTIISIIVVVIVIVGVGYYAINNQISQEKGENMMEEDSMMEEGENMMKGEEGEMIKYSGQVLAGNSAPLLDFNKADYEKVLSSDKLVFLYFYANWCPTCRIEVENSLNPAFNELTNNNVVGFRVNYNDNQTDSDEKNLAREFGVAYQHTKVFLKNGERILKSPESWSKSRYFDEINKAL